MANGRDWLSTIDKGAHEVYRGMIYAQLIRIHNAAWEEQRVEIVRICITEWDVDGEFDTPFCNIPPFDSIVDGRHDLCLRAGGVESLPWSCQLILLEAIGHENCYLFAL